MAGITRRIRRMRRELPCLMGGHQWEVVRYAYSPDTSAWLLCVRCNAWKFN